mgnify:CR=1 FL=1
MSKIVELDNIDRNILRCLQRDASLSIQDIADKVALTTNPCWRRIKRLEESGVIRKRIALIKPEAIGLKTTVFVMIKTDDHSSEWMDVFKACILTIPEIIECHRMTGSVDYLLKMILRDLPHYDQVYQRLIKAVPNLKDVSSSFSMESLKHNSIIDPKTAQLS